MGRELKRKQAKRDGKNVKNVQKNQKDKPLSPKTFIIIMTVLLLFFVILYILTGLFVTKELKWFDKKDNETENTLQIKNKILAAESLKQTEETYYVYYYDTSKEDTEVTTVINKLTEKVYRVDLNDAFNSNFIGEPSGVVSDINNLKVSNPTIIKVLSEQIAEFYSGKEEITQAFSK